MGLSRSCVIDVNRLLEVWGRQLCTCSAFFAEAVSEVKCLLPRVLRRIFDMQIMHGMHNDVWP
jgi:hypothetical protein